MKSKVLFIVSGVASLHAVLLAGLCFTGGCTSPEVLGQRSYIPAAEKHGQLDVQSSDEDLKVTPAPTQTNPVFSGSDLPAQAPHAQMKSSSGLPPFEPVKTETLTYTVQRGDSFWKIGRKYGVNMNDLAAYNNLSSKSPLKVGQVLKIPPGGVLLSPEQLKSVKYKAPRKAANSAKKTVRSTARKAKVHTAAAARPADGLYTVKSGDSLWKIAHRFGIGTKDLAQANSLSSRSPLKIGQRLYIPPKGKSGAPAPKKSSAPAAASQTQSVNDVIGDVAVGGSKPAAKPAASAAPSNPAPAPQPAPQNKPAEVSLFSKTDTVEVSRNISVDKFAQQYGIKVEDIKKLNPDLPKDGQLKANQIIIIPSAE
ncbi:LysM peptidoglycan-binding domain-containing protein [Lentisphaerota bacterium ZTH]|nr:LysM peptidoglycan-binding domain-containing protein [Lentisphaerota bacterium]WET07053.1 LysM peptidoglycan-binding domain-containing protein [Lentisphaerota bacterium ZTH]